MLTWVLDAHLQEAGEWALVAVGVLDVMLISFNLLSEERSQRIY